MPSGQPFTILCQTLARPRTHGRVDLHVHTTCSDGVYTPAQIVELARRSGLAAVALTDHDTLAGIVPAQQAAGDRVEVIAGVEITAEHQGRELHLLGYFVRLDAGSLRTALTRMHLRRAERFREMLQRFHRLGITFDAAEIERLMEQTTLGRRHLAELLVKSGKAANVHEAFQRWLGDQGPIVAPKERLPVAAAIALVRGAGGVAAWAHPPYDACNTHLRELRDLGLQAVEVDYPRCRPGRSQKLRAWAKELGLAVTGGSDCHGPDEPGRSLGACGVTTNELESLRRLSNN
jgi:predicted metal-dependent phosphoesterase TrpH